MVLPTGCTVILRSAAFSVDRSTGRAVNRGRTYVGKSIETVQTDRRGGGTVSMTE